jgi:hypothetical protein
MDGGRYLLAAEHIHEERYSDHRLGKSQEKPLTLLNRLR